jgi:putative endonuclease
MKNRILTKKTLSRTINRQELGKTAEDQACIFLQHKGMRLIKQNYRCYHGEIDLIMRDQDHIVFVEVRSRSRTDFGKACETINNNKIRKLIKAAKHYLQVTKCLDTVHSRFDVIAIQHEIEKTDVQWIKNAFSVENESSL